MRIYEIPIEVDVLGKQEIVFPERVCRDSILNMKKNQGSYVFSCQNYLNPIAKEDQKFLTDWLLYWNNLPKQLKIVICVDPACRTKKNNDYTAMSVHGWDENQNWYILDMYRDKLDKESKRCKKVFQLHTKWSKYSQNRIPVLYETIGFQISDKHYLERMQENKGYKFEIVEMGGGALHKTSKMDRITALQPYFESNSYEQEMFKKIYIPKKCEHYSNFKQSSIDMVQEFLWEYEDFTPENTHEHDDILDTITFPLYWDGFKKIKANKAVKKIKKTARTWGDLVKEIMYSSGITDVAFLKK